MTAREYRKGGFVPRQPYVVDRGGHETVIPLADECQACVIARLMWGWEACVQCQREGDDE